MHRQSVAVAVIAGLIITSTAALVTSGSPAAAASVRPGFSDAALADFNRPTAVEYLPSGQVVVTEQGGRIRVGRSTGGFRTAIDLNVCSSSERGVLGFAHDPGFLGNGLVYVFYTRPSSAPGGCVNRVSRFQMTGSTINPASEFVLLDNISSVNGNHNGGDLDIDGNGNLLVAVGDAGRDPRGDSGSAGRNDAAQDLSLLNGKILRITRTGQPAPGNPIAGTGTATCRVRGNSSATPRSSCREIYAWGLRNPYRIAVDRNDGSGRFFINDVGQDTREEINNGRRAANYGWPAREGRCPQGQSPPCAGPGAAFTDPINDYQHPTGTFITAGAFTPNGFWPGFDGSYLFGDGGGSRIWVRGPNGSIDFGDPFATGVGGIVDMTFGFDSAGLLTLYYVQTGGRLGMIRSTALPPVTTASALRLLSVDPIRAYDTGKAIGVRAGDVFNGTTRLIDLDPPAPYPAALVNITLAEADGPGFVRVWERQGRRPNTASVNVEAAGDAVGSTTIVPIGPDGTFLIEATASGRIVVDVIGWMEPTAGAVAAGRFEGVRSARLIDTRRDSGTRLSSGSTNTYERSARSIDLTATGQLGIPDDGSVGAIVVSIAAIARPDAGGFIGAHRFGTTWPGTSSVNVSPGEVRTNLAIVPVDGQGRISLRTATIAHGVVDVVGYVTSGRAAKATKGRYSTTAPTRAVDSRRNLGFGSLAAGGSAVFDVDRTVPATRGASAVVQYVAVTETKALGQLVAAADQGPVPFVSTVNFGPAQTRAALAFTPLSAAGRERFSTIAATEVVVDIIGYFSG